MATQVAPGARTGPRRRPQERIDLWWVEPAVIFSVLTAFVVYSFFAGIANANYFYEPYLSPLYSPCLSQNCVHPTLPLIGPYWNLSPAILIVGIPVAFRVTCYYYRRSYYRAYFWAPAACTVPDARRRYAGETRFPFLVQNAHRYFLYVATIVLAFLWWDALVAFNFNGRFGVGLGSLVMLGNVLLISFYTASCHSVRYLVGGYVDRFGRRSLRFRLWSLANRLNKDHARWAWASLVVVALVDLYIRLLAMGVISDPRWIS